MYLEPKLYSACIIANGVVQTCAERIFLCDSYSHTVEKYMKQELNLEQRKTGILQNSIWTTPNILLLKNFEIVAALNGRKYSFSGCNFTRIIYIFEPDFKIHDAYFTFKNLIKEREEISE